MKKAELEVALKELEEKHREVTELYAAEQKKSKELAEALAQEKAGHQALLEKHKEACQMYDKALEEKESEKSLGAKSSEFDPFALNPFFWMLRSTSRK